MKLRNKLLLTILALILFLGLATTAWAAEPTANGGLLQGQVTALTEGCLTVQTRKDEVTLLTDEQTVFEVLDDLAVGDFVVVHVVRGEEGTALARRVVVIPNGSLEDKVLRGIVTAVDGETFQLRVRRGEVTVATDENTLFRIPNVEQATVADVKPKMPVAVMGHVKKDGQQAFSAKAVFVIPGNILRQHTVQGKLTAIEGDTLVLATRGSDGDEEMRVQTTDGTTFRVPGVQEATLADLNEGDPIVALGGKDESGDFVAKTVAVARRQPLRVILNGEVTGVGDSSFTLQMPCRCELTVTVTDETRFRIPGNDDAGLDDIAVGDMVIVAGRWNQDGSLQAGTIGKLPQRD